MKQKRINKKISRLQETCYSTVKLCIKFLLWNNTAKYRMFHISGAKLAHRFHISSYEIQLWQKNKSSYFVFVLVHRTGLRVHRISNCLTTLAIGL